MQDIVDPTTAEHLLARKLAIAIRAAKLGIWEWDLQTNEFDYSDTAKRIFGFPIDEPVSRNRIIGVLHPDDHRLAREQAERSLDPALQNREPYRYRIYRADDGELRWIHAFGEPVFEMVDGTLTPVRVIGTVQDVTEEVAAQQRLAHEEARLRLAIEASGIAVWEVNLADQTVTHSPELNRLCGFMPDARPTLEEFRSRYAPGERERIEALGAEARARGDTKLDAEIRHIWPDGTEKWLALKAQLAPGETNYGGRIIGTLIDVSEQKHREQQQSLLVSELKHRIKNSFAVTQAIITQSLRGEELSEGALMKLLQRLQALADAHDEIAKGAWESTSLLAVVNRALVPFSESRNRSISVIGEDVGLVPRAALAFSLVLHELFTNAVKYGSLSSDDGRLTIEITRTGETTTSSLLVIWSEHDGPVVEAPVASGFGTRLIERILAAELDAEVHREFRPEGLYCTIKAPFDRLSNAA